MKKQSYGFIDVKENIILGAVVDGRLEYYDIIDSSKPQLGDIFRARVDRVEPMMKGAFVEIEEKQMGFLLQKDMTDPVVSGQTILVQMTKEPSGGKLPRLSMRYKVLDENIVFDPFREGITLSSKIKDPTIRRRLLESFESIHLGQGSIVIRSHASNATDPSLKRSYQKLSLLQEAIEGEINFLPTPKKIYAHPIDFMKRLASFEINSVITNDKSLHHSLAQQDDDMEILYDHAYESKYDRQVQFGINRAVKRKVEVHPQLSLVIDETEALTAIDVNAIGPKTTMEKNRDCLGELTHQIRLRNIGGVVFIDFLRMNDVQQQLFEKEMKEAFSSMDRKIRFYGFTGSGFYEMAIERKGESLSERQAADLKEKE